MARTKDRGLYLVGDTWYYRFAHPLTGKMVRKSTGTTIKDKAKQLRDKEKTESWDRENLNSAVQWTVRELMEWAWKRYWRFKPRANKREFDWLVKAPLEAFGSEISETLPVDTIQEYINARRLSVVSSTLNREMVYFRSAYYMAIKSNQKLKINPFASIPILDETDRRRHRTATNPEQRKLIEHSAGLLQDCILFDFDSGLRAGQIRELKWTDVELENRKMWLTTYKGRGTKLHRYWVPIYDRALSVLLRRPRLSPYVFCNELGDQIPKYGILHASFTRLVTSLGIEDFNFHDVRHTFATNHWRKNHELLEIHHILGHTKLETTKIYLNLTDLDMIPRYSTKTDIEVLEQSEFYPKITDNQLSAVSSAG